MGAKDHKLDMKNSELEKTLQANRILNVQMSQDVEAQNQHRKQASDQIDIHQGTAEQEIVLKQNLIRELQDKSERHHKLDVLNMEVSHKLQQVGSHLEQQQTEFESGELLREQLESSVQNVLVQRQDVLEQLEK